MQPSVNFKQGLPPTGRSRSHHLMSPAGEQAPRICTNSQEAQRQILLSAAGVEASSDLPSSLSLSLSFKQFRAFSKETNFICISLSHVRYLEHITDGNHTDCTQRSTSEISFCVFHNKNTTKIHSGTRSSSKSQRLPSKEKRARPILYHPGQL